MSSNTLLAAFVVTLCALTTFSVKAEACTVLSDGTKICEKSSVESPSAQEKIIGWVALSDVGADYDGFFSKLGSSAKAVPRDIKPGDILVANREVNVRKGPADFKNPPKVLETGQKVEIIETRPMRAPPTSNTIQIWAQIAQTM